LKDLKILSGKIIAMPGNSAWLLPERFHLKNQIRSSIVPAFEEDFLGI
jgi:hypothetical protein